MPSTDIHSWPRNVRHMTGQQAYDQYRRDLISLRATVLPKKCVNPPFHSRVLHCTTWIFRFWVAPRDLRPQNVSLPPETITDWAPENHCSSAIKFQTSTGKLLGITSNTPRYFLSVVIHCIQSVPEVLSPTAKRPRREAYNTPPRNAAVKNACSCISTTSWRTYGQLYVYVIRSCYITNGHLSQWHGGSSGCRWTRWPLSTERACDQVPLTLDQVVADVKTGKTLGIGSWGGETTPRRKSYQCSDLRRVLRSKLNATDNEHDSLWAENIWDLRFIQRCCSRSHSSGIFSLRGLSCCILLGSVEIMSCMFRLAHTPVSTLRHKLRQSCGKTETCVFVSLVEDKP